MAKRDPLQEKLARLAALRAAPTTTEARRELASALASKPNFLVERAATIAAEAGLADLAPIMEEAFDRFMHDPQSSDKGCRAKTALARALLTLGWSEEAVFLRGVRHVQPEPSFGGAVDTAAELRALCAMGLAQTDYPDTATELVELLVDKEPAARSGAVRALCVASPDKAALLLRLKVLQGDPVPEVLMECFAGLLRDSPSALPFVARYLDERDPEVAQAAALALGGSRLPAALEALKTCWPRCADEGIRDTTFLAIALIRSDAALTHLVTVVREESSSPAVGALRALATYRDDPSLWSRVADAVKTRRELTIREAFAEAFGRR